MRFEFPVRYTRENRGHGHSIVSALRRDPSHDRRMAGDLESLRARGLVDAEGRDRILPDASAPAKQKQGSGQVCCKILRAASTPATVKAAVPQLQMLSPEQLQFSVVLLLFPPSEPLLPGLDTGPPGPDSFAESVLQRSILAHAPPSLG